jgi:RNA 3'-terminal phosphate cyclase (ATP)
MEGGGQILRNTVSLAALLSKSIKIVNIRAKRSNPGLKAQHLEGIKLVGEICGAKIENAYVNSPQIVFSATKRFQPQAKEYKADPKTAGYQITCYSFVLPQQEHWFDDTECASLCNLCWN